MKHLKFTAVMIVLCASISFGAFDYIISDTYEPFGVFLSGNESLLVTGAGATEINASDYSYVKIENTTPYQTFSGGIGIINLLGDSMLDYQGGETATIVLYADAAAVIEGGSIYMLVSHQHNDQGRHIEIICKSYNYDPGTNLLTGTWVDDSAFSIDLIDIPDFTPVIDNIKFTVIPEPATLILLGSGALFLLRRKK